MSIDNPGFETAAAAPLSPGRADGWTTTDVGTAEEWAQFTVGVPAGGEGEAVELFEPGWVIADLLLIGWALEDQQVDALVEGTTAETATFNLGPTPTLYDSFEKLWERPPPPVGDGPPLGTPQWQSPLTYLEAAEFSGYLFESFWWTTVGLYFEETDLDFAGFTGSGEVDGFETGWKGNESYLWSGSWGGAQFADFARPTPGFNDYEGFTKVATRFLITDVSLSSNNLVCDHSSDPLDTNDDVEFVVASASGVPSDLDYSWDLPALPSPLRYRHTYYVTDVEGDTEIGGVALAPDGADIPLTTKGGGEFFICRSRLTHWVSTLDL